MSDDGLDIPECLRLTKEQRLAGWAGFKMRPQPQFKRQEREVDRLYRLSKDRDEAFRKSTTAYVEQKNAFIAKRTKEAAEKKRIKTEAAAAAKENRRTFRRRRK